MPVAIPTPERRRLWVFVFGGLAASVLLLALGIYRLFALSSEATILQRELFAAEGFEGVRRVQGTVGPVLLGGVRTILRFIPDVPSEARDVLAAIKSASVGVYELDALPSAEKRHDAFAAADAAMERRGWTRIVSVTERRQRVVIYTPSEAEEGSHLRVCIAVCDHQQLVVVSARADAEKLGEFVQRQIPKHTPKHI